MDANAIESLGSRFYYGFAATVGLGVLVVVGLAWLLAPGDVAFYSLVGLPVVLFLAGTAVAVATGQRTEAAGHLVATVGWLLVLASVSTDWTPAPLSGVGVANPVFLVGFGLTALGGVVALVADHGDAIQGAVSG